MTEIPAYPKPPAEKVDPVARSMAKRDACAKPCTMGSSSVRVRPMSMNQKVHIRRKKKKHDKRDVQFY